MKIYRAKTQQLKKKKKIRNKRKRSTLPSSHKSLFENVLEFTPFFLTQKPICFSFWHFSVRHDGRFVQSNLLLKTLCKHSMHIHTVNIWYIYISIYIFIYIYIEQDFLQVMAVLSRTHTHARVVLQTEYWTRNNCTAWNFSALFVFFSFVLFPKNAQHLPRSYLYSVTARVKYHLIYKTDLKSLRVLPTVTFTSCICRCT